MNAQKVVTVFADIPAGATAHDKSFVKLYPELDYLFDDGMYIENIVQNHIANDRYISRLFSEAIITLNKTKKAAEIISLPFLR